ncbi:MAG TPA: hemerythrin domain-containing protein [Rhodocyclaceae bacterium]|nr:hemerythrin domain-containing protein [Rhodocyclaceae bacterium]
MINNAIAIIRDEHRSIASVLKGLLNHVAAVKAGKEEADLFLFKAMFDYIEAVPERIHHPKEDEYLFRFLRQRSSEAAAILDELEAQHVKGREDLAELRKILDDFDQSPNIHALDKALTAYAESQWDHMGKEDNVVIPLAEKYLTAEDWTAINTAFEVNRNHNAW